MIQTEIVLNNQLRKCRRYLAKDPIANVLTLGDLYSPLFEVSTVYSAFEDKQVVGVCSVYHGLSKPSVVFGTATSEVKKILAEKAMRQISDDFISLCLPDEIEILKEYALLLHLHTEQQMVTRRPRKVKYSRKIVKRVSRNGLKELEEFYVKHHSEAWSSLQFKVGPYFCIRQKKRIISAAGVHLLTPQIAQLGNILTDEAWRKHGFATACTSVLASHLASNGRIISLFVKTDNTQAINVYRKLGFSKKRDISFVVMRKRP
jgi:ribosomal protein S18 acetylase RimI-like enzyme